MRARRARVAVALGAERGAGLGRPVPPLPRLRAVRGRLLVHLGGDGQRRQPISLARFQTAFTALPQGRPLGFFLPDLLSFIGDKLGGLPAITCSALLVVTLNTFLCYRLLRVRVPVAPAAVGAAVFCLFPADTTKILLTHDFQLQPSLTFALLAALAYAAGRRPLAYLLGAGALAVLRERLPGAVRVAAVRAALGSFDCRARSLTHVAGADRRAGRGRRWPASPRRGPRHRSVGGVGEILPVLLGSLVLGPGAQPGGDVLRAAARPIPGWDVETVVAGGAGAASASRRCCWLTSASARHAPGRRGREARCRLAPPALAMLVLGYGLAFTHYPPNAVVGRGTSVHLGATLGMSVLAAAVAWLLLGLRPRLATALLAGYLALAVGYYVTIERDFMRSWQLQRAFWQQVVACCSDLQDGTVLLYELNAVGRADVHLHQLVGRPAGAGRDVRLPVGWANPPRLFSLTQWLDRVQPDGDHLRWWVPGASWDEHWEVLPQANVILLRRAPDGAPRRASLARSTSLASRSSSSRPARARAAWPPGRSSYEPAARSAAMRLLAYAALATRNVEFYDNRVFDPPRDRAHAPLARADGHALAAGARRWRASAACS